MLDYSMYGSMVFSFLSGAAKKDMNLIQKLGAAKPGTTYLQFIFALRVKACPTQDNVLPIDLCCKNYLLISMFKKCQRDTICGHHRTNPID